MRKFLKIDLLAPLIPIVYVTYIIVELYSRYFIFSKPRLVDLGMDKIYLSINDGSPELISVFHQEIIILIIVSVLYCIIHILNYLIFKKRLLNWLWVVYVCFSFVYLTNISKNSTSITIITFTQTMNKLYENNTERFCSERCNTLPSKTP